MEQDLGEGRPIASSDVNRQLKDIEEATGELREVKAPYANARFPLNPVVLPWSAYTEFDQACRALFDGVDALLGEVCGGDIRKLGMLSKALPYELPLVEAVPGHDWSLVARPDVVFAGGRAIIVEPNSDSPAALFALHDILLRSQQKYLTAEEVRGMRPIMATPRMAELIRERLVHPDGLLAICYWRREENAGPLHWYYGCHARELARYGIRARVCAVEDLEFAQHDVRLNGEIVGAIYRFFEAPEPGAAAERELLTRLLTVANAGGVGLFTGYRGEICASKIVLALLTDERFTGRLPKELAVRIERHIPWTRIVEDRPTRYRGKPVNLLTWARDRRDHLVLKAVRGRGGEKVLIGRETPPADWERALADAAGSAAGGRPWVIQELAAPATEEFAATDGRGGVVRGVTSAIYSVFVLDRKVAGVMRRASVGGSLNINGRTGFVPGPVWWRGAPSGAAGPTPAQLPGEPGQPG